MAFPRPQGARARFAPGWAYLTVPTVSGYSLDVQANVDGTWQSIEKWGSEYPMAVYQDGRRTQWRARYKRSGSSGAWTTGRVWHPDNFEEDGGDQPTPPAPTGLTSNATAGTWFTVSWVPPPDVDELRLTVNGGDPVILGADARSYRVEPATPYSVHRVAVTAVRDGVESDPASIDVLTTLRMDGKPGPADPDRLEVVEVTATTATVAWHQADLRAVAWWQVGAQEIPWQYPTEPQVTFTGLTPATSYEVLVLARGHDRSMSESAEARITVTTQDDQPPEPTPAQPTGLKLAATDVPGRRATVAWRNAADAEFWRVRLAGGRWRVVRTAQAVFAGLTAGRSYGWEVVAVATDGDGYEYESTPAGDEFTFADTTPPPQPLRPPQGLTVHCITTGSGKAEWQQDPTPDACELWLDDDRATSAYVTTKTLVALRDLEPQTWYRVNVVARQGEPGTPGYRESEPAVERFQTLAEHEKPPPPPPPIEGDLPAPTNLVVRSDGPSSLAATWDDARPDVSDTNFYYATVDGRRWQRVNGGEATFEVQAGQAYTVSVYGVFGNRLTSIARKAATVRGAH